MSVVIEGYDKPKSCLSCPFNRDDCWCSITHGGIDRDYYDCDKPCPIKPLDSVLDEIRGKIESKEMVETTSERGFYNMALNDVLQIIDKYKKG